MYDLYKLYARYSDHVPCACPAPHGRVGMRRTHLELPKGERDLLIVEVVVCLWQGSPGLARYALREH